MISSWELITLDTSYANKVSHSSVLPVTQIGTATKGFNLKPSLEPPYIMGRQDGLGMLESQQWEERRGWQSPKSLRAHPCISPLCKNQRVSAPCSSNVPRIVHSVPLLLSIVIIVTFAALYCHSLQDLFWQICIPSLFSFNLIFSIFLL